MRVDVADYEMNAETTLPFARGPYAPSRGSAINVEINGRDKRTIVTQEGVRQLISTNRVYKPAQKGLESARVLEGKESTHTERAGRRRDGGRGWRQGMEGGENLFETFTPHDESILHQLRLS